MSSASYNRSLTTVKTELEFLMESEVITESLYQHIIDLLPERYVKGMAAIDYNGSNSNTATKSVESLAPPAAPPVTRQRVEQPVDFVEAIYDFQPQQPDDLKLTRGDKVKVLQKVSSSWWKGSCDGRTGMFPSNYVKSLGGNESSPNSTRASSIKAPSNPPPSYDQFQQQQQQPYQQQSYQQQPYQQQLQPQQQYFQQPVQQPYYQQMPAQVQQAPVQVQQQQQEPSKFKKFGSQLGNAAIFGAGATIGSDLVNSIF